MSKEALKKLRRDLQLSEHFLSDTAKDSLLLMIEETLNNYEVIIKIIKTTRVDINLIKLSKNYDEYCCLETQKILTIENQNLVTNQKGITKAQYKKLKEVFQ